MRLQGINGIQEIDASKEKQGESDGCTFLDSSKAVLKNEATGTVFGCEKLQDNQEVVLRMSISANYKAGHFPVSMYPTAKVKSIIFAMLPKVRTNTNDNAPQEGVKRN